MKKIIIGILSLCSLSAYSQVDENYHFKGLVMNDEEYDQIPEQPMQLSRDYAGLPSSWSLQQYCPTPKNQGQYGTCTSWATAYAARTIVEAVRNGWTDKNTIDKETFSPPFVYKQIKDAKDIDCQDGTSIEQALALMKKTGVPKYYSFDPMCAEYIPTKLFTEAIDYRIENFSKLFYSSAGQSEKIQKTKKALSENCPVIIGMDCYASFDNVKDVWNGVKDEYEGGHAMCVVAYDDQKYGGAFLLMNSWGTKWGVDGFGWVRYADYAGSTKYAYQVFVPKKSTPLPNPNPTPKPATNGKPSISWNCPQAVNTPKFMVKAGLNSKNKITDIAVLVNGSRSRGINSVTNDGFEAVVNQEVTLSPGKNKITIEVSNAAGTTKVEKDITYTVANTNTLSGSFYVQLATGEKMQVSLNSRNSIPTYIVNGGYISGTRYRVYISNNEPAYVYVIASDLNNAVSKVFPPADNISPALVYKTNNIALPNEDYYMEMDNTVGTDYLCVLYSKESLDINSAISEIKSAKGNFYQRISSVFGSKIAKMSTIALTSDKIDFNAQTSGTIVPIVLEITHK